MQIKGEGEMIVYTKLWLLLKERGMKRTDLLNVISSATLAKLGKNETVSSEVLSKICDFLKCQPGDIMENVTKEDIVNIGTQMNDKMSKMIDTLSAITDKSREELVEEFLKETPQLMEMIKSGKKDFFGINDFIKKMNEEE